MLVYRRIFQLGDKSRKCGLWVKMKPEYSDQTADIDLIVLAGGFASGAMRSGLLSRFLLGVAVPTADGSPAKKFWPVTKVRHECRCLRRAILRAYLGWRLLISSLSFFGACQARSCS